MIGSIAAGVAAFLLLLSVGISPVLAWMAGWSVPGFAMYGIDKRQARAGGWRVPEVLLHGLALVGGVVGAWAGRAVFHHKTQETVFLVVLVIASVLWVAIVFAAMLR